MADFISIGRLADYTPGQVHSLQVNGQPVCVVRLGDRLYAVSGLCTHEYIELSYGYVMGREIFCGQHEAGFDLQTGEVTRGPAEFDLKSYPLMVEGDEVFLDATR